MKKSKKIEKDAHINSKEIQLQQVLFNEPDVSLEQTPSDIQQTVNVTEQVVFDNDNYAAFSENNNQQDSERREDREASFTAQAKEAPQGARGSWLWRTIGSLFALLLFIELFDFFVAGFEQSPIITSLYGVLLVLLTLVTANSLWHEFIGLKHFKRRQKVKKQAEELLVFTAGDNEHSNQQGKAFCDKISESLPCDLLFDNKREKPENTTHLNSTQVWLDAVSSDHSSAELVQLYSRVVLSKVDEKALNEVAKFSTEAVVLVALSPVALLDMLIMLSRNLRMINKIAGLYGLKLGYWSRIKLIKQVFINMAYAGASELIADFGSDMLGAELLGKLSARFAQGLGAGMLTARLGAKTMELCRPIPFEEKPKLNHVRKEIAQQLKTLIGLSK